MTIKAVLFDLDGTLLNSLDDLADSANEALRQMGYPTHATEKYNYFVGGGVVNLMKSALAEEQYTEKELTKAVQLKKAHYTNNWANKSTLYKGVPLLLDAIEKSPLKMGVLSNKPQEFTAQIIGKLFKNWHFDHVSGAKEGIPIKPAPDAALAICKEWGFHPSEIAYIGDTRTDMETAVNTGMLAIGVTWGFRPESELLEFGAEHICHSPDEILELVLKEQTSYE